MLQWLVPVNCVLVAVVVVLSFGFILEYEEINLRLTAAVAIFAQMVTLGLLARGERRGDLHYGTLLLGVLVPSLQAGRCLRRRRMAMS